MRHHSFGPPGVLVAVIGVAACAAALGVVLLTGASAPSLLYLPAGFHDPSVLTFHSAHWDSTRLPQDRRNPKDEIHMRDRSLLAQMGKKLHSSRDERHVGEKINNAVRALDFVGGSAKGAPKHWLQPAEGNTGLRVVSRSMAGELADNSAAALRQQSFRWALDDCKKEASCETLLGKRMYNVLQTKSDRPNLAIYHDQDDDRKEEEREMEHDYRAAARNSEGEDGESQSKNRWQKLQGMMHKSFKASAPTARTVLQQVDQIDAEEIPETEKRILISALMRKSRVARRAATLNDSYRSETSLIFPSNSKAHWNTYKASMMPSGEDDREELGMEQQQFARPSEADMLRKYQAKAYKELSDSTNSNRKSDGGMQVNALASSRDSKQAISKSAQRQVAEWTKQASAIRHKLGDGSVSALRSKKVAEEKSRDANLVESTQDAIQDELSRYGSVFSAHADEDKLMNEEHVARKALRQSRRRERRLQRERALQHNKVVAAEVKEAKTANAELASYDDAFVPHARTAGPSMAELGLLSSKSGRSGRDGEGKRGRNAARDFATPGDHPIPHDTAAEEEARDEHTAQEIAPMVQLAENTLKSIGHMKRQVSRHADGKCYIAGGKEVPCSELAQLGKMLTKVYGKKAADVEIVSRDHTFDPTKVFADSSSALKAEQRWMRIEGGGDDTHSSSKLAGGHDTHSSSKLGDFMVNSPRSSVAEADSTGGERGNGDTPDRRSVVGELLHEANVKAAKQATKPVHINKGPLTTLSDRLGNIISIDSVW